MQTQATYATADDSAQLLRRAGSAEIDTMASKAMMMLVAGPPVAAGIRGWVDSRYPQHGEKLSAAAKMISIGSLLMTLRGGKHALKFFVIYTVFAVPEGYTFGRSLGRAA